MNAAQYLDRVRKAVSELNSAWVALSKETDYGNGEPAVGADIDLEECMSAMVHAYDLVTHVGKSFSATESFRLSLENSQSIKACRDYIRDMATGKDTPDNVGDKHHCSACGATDKCDCVSEEFVD